MNAKISVFVICVEAIIYLLLYNLHDCTFNIWSTISFRYLKTAVAMQESTLSETGSDLFF